MPLDINKLLESNFYLKNSIFYNRNLKKHIHISDKKRVLFDTTIVTEKLLDIILANPYKDSAVVHPSLFSNLHFSTLDQEWKNEIISQWKEILHVTRQIKIYPIWSILIITLPGCYMEPHQHTELSKQTLTFRYVHSDSEKYNTKSYIGIHDKDRIIELENIESPKSYFTLKDNVLHSASIDQLSFFWIFDYPEYLDLSKYNFDPFKVCNFLK